MARLVQKFGGSSVKDSKHIQNVAQIVANTYKSGKELVVVVSAMGDSTDQLLELASQVSEVSESRELDVLLATGEQVSISMLALALQSMGMKARSFTGPQAGIITDDTHGFARIKTVHPSRIEASLRAGEIAVVAGFQGMTRSSELTTLGRGGSDTTAVALAAALKAECCDIYTDVDGVYSTDPRVVKQAKRIPAISYDEMLALSSHGAQVLNARSVELAMKNKVAIRCRSTFAPDDLGTLVSSKEETPNYRVCGVASDSARVSFKLDQIVNSSDTISGEDLDRHHAKVNTLIDRLEEIGVPREKVLSHKAEGTVTTEIELNCEKRIAKSVQKAIEIEFPNGEIRVDRSVSTISIIGTGVHSDKQLRTDFLKTLADAEITVSMMMADELSLSAVIPEMLRDEAIRKVHKRFCEDSNTEETFQGQADVKISAGNRQ